MYSFGGSEKPLFRNKQTVYTYTGANVGAYYSGISWHFVDFRNQITQLTLREKDFATSLCPSYEGTPSRCKDSVKFRLSEDNEH